MNYTEQLQRAAKAAGYQVTIDPNEGFGRWPRGSESNRAFWSPIFEDGDAFRLCVDLDLFKDLDQRASEIVASEPFKLDRQHAYRRAAVELAAERALEEA